MNTYCGQQKFYNSFLLGFILKNNQLNALKLLFTKHIKTNIYITK